MNPIETDAVIINRLTAMSFHWPVNHSRIIKKKIPADITLTCVMMLKANNNGRSRFIVGEAQWLGRRIEMCGCGISKRMLTSSVLSRGVTQWDWIMLKMDCLERFAPSLSLSFPSNQHSNSDLSL